jgi:transposase-like protein
VPSSHAPTWTKKGQAHQERVRSRWGSEVRVNLIGTLRLEGQDGRLYSPEFKEEAIRLVLSSEERYPVAKIARDLDVSPETLRKLGGVGATPNTAVKRLAA